MQQMLQQLLAMQEKADADRKAYQEKVDADRKAFKERMDALIANIRFDRKETTACQEVTGANPEKIELDSGMMQSAEEHQEFTQKDAVAKPVGEPRKRRRVGNLAAGRRQKRKKRTRGSCESKRRSAAACRKVSRRATVAWRKRNLIRRSGTQGNCGPLKEFSPTGIRTTRCAKVARPKRRSYKGPSVEQGRRKNETRNKFTNGNRRGRKFGKRSRVDPEGSTGVKDPNTRRHRRLKNEKTAGRIF
jgi:hypothetical protein